MRWSPCVAVLANARLGAATSLVARAAPMRLLIVEDEVLLAAQIDKFLRDRGFDSSSARRFSPVTPA